MKAKFFLVIFDNSVASNLLIEHFPTKSTNDVNVSSISPSSTFLVSRTWWIQITYTIVHSFSTYPTDKILYQRRSQPSFRRERCLALTKRGGSVKGWAKIRKSTIWRNRKRGIQIHSTPVVTPPFCTYALCGRSTKSAGRIYTHLNLLSNFSTF